MTSDDKHRNSLLMTCHHPDLGNLVEANFPVTNQSAICFHFLPARLFSKTLKRKMDVKNVKKQNCKHKLTAILDALYSYQP